MASKLKAVLNPKTNEVKVSWKSVTGATFYVVSRNQLDDSGNPDVEELSDSETGTDYDDDLSSRAGKGPVSYIIQGKKPGATATDPAVDVGTAQETNEVTPLTKVQKHLKKWWWKYLIILLALVYLAIAKKNAWFPFSNSVTDGNSANPAAPQPAKTEHEQIIDALKGLQGIIPEGTNSTTKLVNTDTVKPIARAEAEKVVDERFGPKAGGTPSDPAADPSAPRVSGGSATRSTTRPAVKPTPPAKTGGTGTTGLAKSVKPRLDEMEIVYKDDLPFGKWQMLFSMDKSGKPSLVDKKDVKTVYMSDLTAEQIPAQAAITGLPDDAKIILRAKPNVRNVKIPYGGSAIEMNLTEPVMAKFQSMAEYRYIAIVYKDGKQLPPVKAYVMTFGDSPDDMAPGARTSGPGSPTSLVPPPTTDTSGSTLPAVRSGVASTRSATDLPSTKEAGVVFLEEPKRVAPVTTRPDGSIEIDERTFVDGVVKLQRRGSRVLYTNRLHDTGNWPADALGVAMFDSRYQLDEVVPIYDASGRNLGRSARGDLFVTPTYTLYRDPNRTQNGGWTTTPGTVVVKD